MAHKYLCDRCGNEMAAPGRVTLNVAVSQPHDASKALRFDKDLCPNCYAIFGSTLDAWANSQSPSK